MGGRERVSAATRLRPPASRQERLHLHGMSSEPEASPRPAPPAAAGDRDVERRLRTLASACAAPAAAALVTAGTVGWMALRGGGSGGAGGASAAGDPGNPASWEASPPFACFLVALGAMLLVLLASAVHGRILRREASGRAVAAAGEAPAGDEHHQAGAESGDEGRLIRPRRRPAGWLAERLSAYSWATAAAFAMLAAAVALGAALAFGGGAPLYGLVICLASLAVMGARWPRRGTFDLALGAAGGWQDAAPSATVETSDGPGPGA
jgi:hypothetical protein